MKSQRRSESEPQPSTVSTANARIEICGGIASGKTSLARLLEMRGVSAAYEDFSANPFYEAFYANPIDNAFETEVTFLLQHFHLLKQEINVPRLRVFDFSTALDLAYSMVTLGVSDRQTFDAVFDAVYDKLGPPRILVNLRCSASVEIDRIRARGRVAEQSITVDYLEEIALALDVVLRSPRFASCRVLDIDSESLNYVTNQDAMNLVVGYVRDAAN